jgi:hypothetical protein
VSEAEVVGAAITAAAALFSGLGIVIRFAATRIARAIDKAGDAQLVAARELGQLAAKVDEIREWAHDNTPLPTRHRTNGRTR